MIDAAEDVEEPIDDKPRRRLKPARVEADDTGVAVELKRTLDAIWWGRPVDVPERKRRTVTDRRPAVSNRVEIDTRDSADATGYSSITSTSA